MKKVALIFLLAGIVVTATAQEAQESSQAPDGVLRVEQLMVDTAGQTAMVGIVRTPIDILYAITPTGIIKYTDNTIIITSANSVLGTSTEEIKYNKAKVLELYTEMLTKLNALTQDTVNTHPFNWVEILGKQ